MATLALPESGSRWFLIAGEGLLILLAAADFLVPKSFRLAKRLTSPARTFLTMNWAALLAVLVFWVSPTKLWVPTRVKPAAQP